jgi:tight adherence protein B
MWLQRRPDPRRAGVLVGGCAAMVGGLAIGAAAVVPLGLAVGEVVRRALVAHRHRESSGLRAEVAGWCVAVASELQVGRVPEAALAAASEASAPSLRGLLAPVAAVAALGGDVPASLRACATRPGAEAMRHVAACWAVASDAGAGLATALQRLGSGLRAAERVRGEVTAQLASARASARLLAGLPVFGVVLGGSMGARPLQFLLHTSLGAACAAVAVVLNVIGLWWTDRIAARVPVP